MNSEKLKLYAVLLGARESGYLLEQHKYFFCVASGLEEVKVKAKEFWRQAINVHIDAYICLEEISGHRVILQDECNSFSIKGIDINKKLFFVNLGGYYRDIFAEVHKQFFVVASNGTEAKILAKQNSFFNDENLLQDHNCKPHVDDVVSVDELLSTQGWSVKLKKLHDYFSARHEPEVVITGFMRI